MKSIIIIPAVLLLFVISSSKTIDVCGCNYLGTATHKRIKVKDRSPANPSGAIPLRVSDILSMKATKTETATIKKDENNPVVREKQIVTVSGYAWIIKESDDDCDVHIEMSETNSKTTKRIIAEIPNTNPYCTFRSSVLGALVTKFHLPAKKAYHFDNGDNGGKAIKITVTGYLFWDSGHPTGNNHGSVHVGSVWEVHPISKLRWDK